MPAFHLSDFLIAVLDLWSTYPLTFLALAVPLVLLAFRLAFRAGLKITVQQESRAVQLERTKEHEARAAHLRLVAKRMSDKEVA